MSEPSLITDRDLYLFNEGTHYRLYEHLGAHLAEREGTAGVSFAVWAPDAASVSVMGDWSAWDTAAHPLALRGTSGVWEGFVPGVEQGARYKYHVVSRYNGYRVDKADPLAFYAEVPPAKASVVWDLGYAWGDGEWMAGRAAQASPSRPMAIYEVHLGSWQRVPEEGNRSLTYREIAPKLAAHVKRMGFTHVELMPVMEHPFYGSWGYQVTGYFAATSRHGTPQDLMYLIDHLHQEGIGVLLDWVPSHFPTDEHGLNYFDGTHLYEHADPKKGFHPDWGSLIFNYGRSEVKSFLASSAVYWLDKFHADGLRVDAVASMLYLDYSRKAGEWVPNLYGGRENLEAIDFLRAVNTYVREAFPDTEIVAEESTAWPKVSHPVYEGGLGFHYKWDMGWMHDTLSYFQKDPIFRSHDHGKLTFRSVYAWSEKFLLPLSHDEVVHGKGSLLTKMPGDFWQRRANLRLLYGLQYAQPGKKLLFMGAELASFREWDHDSSLDWHLLERPEHEGIRRWLEDLNRLYREEPALHELDLEPEGFEWIDGTDAEHCVIAFLRRGADPGDTVAVVVNATPVPRHAYGLGVPTGGFWQELLNSDSGDYGGSGVGNYGGVEAKNEPRHGRPYSLSLTLPPLAAIFLKAGGTAPLSLAEAVAEQESEEEEMAEAELVAVDGVAA